LLFGIWGTAADNLWAVGDDKISGGTIWHYDGSTWSVFDTSATLPDGILPLNKVWGRSANEIYAVGDQGTVLFFDGTNWTKLDGITRQTLFTVHGNASMVDAVGGFLTDSALIERTDDVFVDETPACAPGLNGVFVPDDGRAVAVGTQLAVVVRDDDGWHFQYSKPGDTRDFHGTWVDSEGGIWAVGGDLADLVNGVLAYGGPRTINKPSTVSYANDVVPLFADKGCTSMVCHGGFFPASGYDLSTYESSFMAGDEAKAFGILPIVPNDPDSSYLVEKISTDMPRNGVRMPNGLPPLSAAEIDLIRTWISEGAQNN
jgi:hypothetical protein